MADTTDELLTKADDALGALLDGDPVQSHTEGSVQTTYFTPEQLIKSRQRLAEIAKPAGSRVRHASFENFRG